MPWRNRNTANSAASNSTMVSISSILSPFTALFSSSAKRSTVRHNVPVLNNAVRETQQPAPKQKRFQSTAPSSSTVATASATRARKSRHPSTAPGDDHSPSRSLVASGMQSADRSSQQDNISSLNSVYDGVSKKKISPLQHSQLGSPEGSPNRTIVATEMRKPARRISAEAAILTLPQPSGNVAPPEGLAGSTIRPENDPKVQLAKATPKLFSALSFNSSSGIQNAPITVRTTSSASATVVGTATIISSSATAVLATTSSTSPAPLCCDKCDGKHETDQCPYFKKQREDHPDARRGNKSIGGTSRLPGAHLTASEARIVRQPGDGSCLFHSISRGLGRGSANQLRADICKFIADNPTLMISDSPLKQWVLWDSNGSVSDYVRRMRGGAWGGGIEMACVSQMMQVNVHVYEQSGSSGFKRISAFDYPHDAASKRTVRVLYRGGVHYDALDV